MLLPDNTKRIVNYTLNLTHVHPQHHLASIRREFIYEAFTQIDDPVSIHVRGWLAVTTAEFVLPFFQQQFANTELPDGVIDLPHNLITHAYQVLQGSANEQQTRNYTSWAHEEFSLMLNEAYYNPQEFPMNGVYAGIAAEIALQEALRRNNFLTFMHKEWHKAGTPYLKPFDLLTVQEFNVEWNDTASAAARAYSCSPASKECEPERLEEFWVWWLTKAIPQAWERAHTDASTGMSR